MLSYNEFNKSDIKLCFSVACRLLFIAYPLYTKHIAMCYGNKCKIDTLDCYINYYASLSINLILRRSYHEILGFNFIIFLCGK